MTARFPSLALARPGTVKYYAFLNKLREAIGAYTNPVEQARAIYRAHEMLTSIHGKKRWDLAKSADELNLQVTAFAAIYARGAVICNPPKEVKAMAKRPPKYADLHHVHFLCPRPLWIKFLRMFPSKGDITRGMIEAMEAYIGLHSKAKLAELDALEQEGTYVD